MDAKAAAAQLTAGDTLAAGDVHNPCGTATYTYAGLDRYSPNIHIVVCDDHGHERMVSSFDIILMHKVR